MSEQATREGCGPGPWDDEPDRIEFRVEGLPCLMVRNPMGAWCGYVAVPPGHPEHGVHYDDSRFEGLVHGGLTFSGFSTDYITFTPEHGEYTEVWWFGFDCSHYTDLSPTMGFILPGVIYRDVAYVQGEIQRLANALVMAGN